MFHCLSNNLFNRRRNKFAAVRKSALSSYEIRVFAVLPELEIGALAVAISVRLGGELFCARPRLWGEASLTRTIVSVWGVLNERHRFKEYIVALIVGGNRSPNATSLCIKQELIAPKLRDLSEHVPSAWGRKHCGSSNINIRRSCREGNQCQRNKRDFHFLSRSFSIISCLVMRTRSLSTDFSYSLYDSPCGRPTMSHG